MDKQLICDRLSTALGQRVSVGLQRWIEDKRDTKGRIIEQIVHDEGEKFTFVDTGGPVPQEDIDAATAWLEANPPPPPPAYISYAALRERMTAAEREAILTLRRTNWQIDDFVTWAAGAGGGIDLNSTAVADAKAALVAAGVFVPAGGQTMLQRADEIFSA